MSGAVKSIAVAVAVALGVASGGSATAGATIQNEDDVFLPMYDSSGFIELGYGFFSSDPDPGPGLPAPGRPGDAIMACDEFADGWGIAMQLDINPSGGFTADRTASTAGHDSPYCTPYATGDLPEGTPVAVRVCQVRKGFATRCNAPEYSQA